MISSEYLLNKVNSIYSSYAAEKEDTESAAEQTLMKNAGYADLKYRLKACVFDLQKAKAFDDDKKVKALETTEKDLTEKIAALKKFLAVKESVYVPHCKTCNDTGYVDKKRCVCYYRTLNDAAYGYLGITSPKTHTFFDNTLSDEKTEKRVEKFKNYCDNFSDDSKNLMFLGGRGTGKTFFAECIADRLNKSGKNALLINAFALNDVFLKLAYANGIEQLTIKNVLTTCDLLIVDDLGAAPILKKITAEGLLMVISERLSSLKPFVVTTNLNLDEIGEKFGERVFSRMCGKTTVKIPFDGKDLRLFD